MLLLCAGAFCTFVAKSPPMHKEEGNQQHVDMEISEVRLHGNREHSNKINLVYLNENLLLARVFSFYWRKCFFHLCDIDIKFKSVFHLCENRFKHQ
jgi:hypothetical protein